MDNVDSVKYIIKINVLVARMVVHNVLQIIIIYYHVKNVSAQLCWREVNIVRHNNDYNPSQCHLISCPGQDYFINDRYKCQKCGYDCKICDNANTCLKCHCLYTMINKQCFASVGTLNYENCDENEYKANLRCRDNEFNNNGKCQACAPICKTCTKTQTTCTSCKEGYTFFANNNTCVDGNYLDIKFINIILLISILLF